MQHPWNLSALQPEPEMMLARLENNRAQIHAWTVELFHNLYGGEPDPESRGQCVYWAHSGCAVLRLCGYRPVLQAGSMSWPIQPDRKTNHTHFSYQWDVQNIENALRVVAGAMPEMHAWIALPDENEIVDFATAGFREVATKRHGMIWELPDAPPYLWARSDLLPAGVIYRPQFGAMRYLYERLNKDCEMHQQNAPIR